MAFKLNITEEDLAKPAGGGLSYISTSGIYDVTILAATEDTNDNGAITIGLYVDLGNNNTQMLYGALPLATYDNKTELTGNVKAFATLLKLAGKSITGNIETVDAVLPIGKAGVAKEVSIIEGVEDIECKLWVKYEYYRKKDGTIGENRTIKGVFRSDKASSDEIVKEEQGDPVEIGTTYAKLESKFTDTKYGAGVTPEDVDAMIAARSGKEPAKTSPQPSTAADTPKRSRFAK